MGSIGASRSTAVSTPQTRTEMMVNRISNEVQDWIDDSYMDEDDKESVNNWHDLLEQLDMTAAEARETIIDSLESDVWDNILNHRSMTEDERALTFDDGEFEDENGNFLKYGQVMKLVKENLVRRGILKKST